MTPGRGRIPIGTGNAPGVLVAFGGLPATGKTTIAKEVVRLSGAVYLRIDAIEQAIRSAGVLRGGVGPAGYGVAYELAASNLELGRTVVADCVNPLPVTRASWRGVAAGASAALIEIEVICSDTREHRRRVATRASDIAGLAPPNWAAVTNHDYEPWSDPRLVLDTAKLSAAEAVSLVLLAMEARQHGRA